MHGADQAELMLRLCKPFFVMLAACKGAFLSMLLPLHTSHIPMRPLC
jgi:hypothetical protein